MSTFGAFKWFHDKKRAEESLLLRSLSFRPPGSSGSSGSAATPASDKGPLPRTLEKTGNPSAGPRIPTRELF